MKARPVFLAALAALLVVAQATARPVLSPIINASEAADGPIQSLAVTELPAVGKVINLFVSGIATDAELEAHGAIIGSRLPNGMRTVMIPADRVAELATLQGLTRISAAYRCKKYNNVSVPTTNATPGFWTHSGAGVFAGTAGTNVILGDVDSGIDIAHDDFKKPDGTTRILYIWDQNDAGGPAPAAFGFGTEWTAADINNGVCTHSDFDGHGTHVMGSAAGDGSATGNGQPAYQFWGVAPKADIIMVATDFNSAHIVNGVDYIFQKAAAAGKNAVVNLSLGLQFGAHDGTEDFDTGITALTGAGRIVCVAAGNDGGAARHAEQLVPPGPAQTITFNVPSYSANPGAVNDLVLIDSYYPASANMRVTLTSPGPSPITVGPVSLGGTAGNAGSLAGNLYVENGFTPSPSGDRNIYIQIYDSNELRPPRAGTWTITLTPVSTSASTEFDGWIADYQVGALGAAVAFTSDVDEAELIASPGSAVGVITAGAYVTKGSWPSIDGNSYQFPGLTVVGERASFSSPGPLRNGAQKPDITGPGSAIVSSRSSLAPYSNPYINPDGKHVTELGTSMASPHVAGACALLLAATPNQTPAQLKTRLAANAIVDGNTGAVPNALWGYGKLRILNADGIPPLVTVNSPNGGETWAMGSGHNITWTASDNTAVTSITLEYSTNNGGAWTTIATGETNDGTYPWTVPSIATTQALVRARAFDAAANSAQDASNAVFTIADQTVPTVAVTSPNGGESWAAGSAHNITWTASDNIAVTSITLEYSTNNGGAWTTIATGEANDGTYAWSVPNTLTTQALVRVRAFDAATNSAQDPSNAVFTIADQSAPSATLTSPNGGESWNDASTHAITWNASDNIAVTSIKLELSTNNGGAWTTIATGEANDGTYDWLVPNTPSTQALVRVVAADGSGNLGNDQSNAVFTIVQVTGVENQAASFSRPTLMQNRPNPFGPVTHIGFGLPSATPVKLAIYSLDGRRVRTLAAGTFGPGYHELTWNGRNERGDLVRSGVYFCRFESGPIVETKRMVLGR